MKKAFNSWQQGARYYAPCLAVGLVLFLVFKSSALVYLSVPFLAAGSFILYFFRDPPRPLLAEANELVSPADGLIVGIEDLDETPYYDGPCRRISIFLSIFNVHVNRAPMAATVCDVVYKPGEFKNAMKAETTDCNESNAVFLDTDYGPMTVRQISGLVARRIVCVVDEGARLEHGEKFGMIKFGSRTELYMPKRAEVSVKLKDKVKAGATVVARFT